MTKQTITKGTQLKIEGLLSLAHYYDRLMMGIESSIAEELEVESDSDVGRPYYGHISDAVYTQDTSVKGLLGLLKVKVK